MRTELGLDFPNVAHLTTQDVTILPGKERVLLCLSISSFGCGRKSRLRTVERVAHEGRTLQCRPGEEELR